MLDVEGFPTLSIKSVLFLHLFQDRDCHVSLTMSFGSEMFTCSFTDFISSYISQVVQESGSQGMHGLAYVLLFTSLLLTFNNVNNVLSVAVEVLGEVNLVI